MDCDPMDDTYYRMNAAFTRLEDAVYYTLKVLQENGPKLHRFRLSEHERRQNAVRQIEEILDFKPLDRFQAEHLEYLILLLCYWRELEDGSHGGDGPNRKPLVKGPDPLQ
jgi:hypothetical protein